MYLGLWAVDSSSYLSKWNRSVLKRCIRIPSMFCFLTMMWGCILVRLEPSQKKWRRILRSVFPSTVLPSYIALSVLTLSVFFVAGRYLYKLDIPSIYLLAVWAAIVYMNTIWYVCFSLKLNVLQSCTIRTMHCDTYMYFH